MAVTPIEQLRAVVDPWLSSADDIALHKNSAAIRQLIDQLIQSGQPEAAVPYLQRYLRATPRDFDYQLTLAEILGRHGDSAELTDRVDQVIRLAENDTTLRRAYQLARRALPAPPPPLTRESIGDARLVLLKVGDISDLWLAELREKLAKRLGAPVTIARLDVDLGKPDRAGRQAYVEQFRRYFLRRFDAAEILFIRFAASEGYNREKLSNDDDAVLRFARILAKRSSKVDLQELEKQISAANALPPQWSDAHVLPIIALALPSSVPGVRFLAVTNCDLYTSGANYVFGSARIGGQLAIMSARRFTAEFNQEAPDRRRLQKRLLKQALSSYAFTLGLPRCTSPDCARAYASMLAEHDAKSEDLCADCRRGFEQALGHALQPNE